MSLQNARRGNAAIFALTLIPLLGFGALSVDVGMQRMTETQVQAAAEAASSGGAAYLNGTEAGLVNAIARAKIIGEANFVYGGNFQIDDSPAAGQIELIIYDGTAAPADRIRVVDSTTADFAQVNAVRVTPATTADAILARFAFQVETLDTAGQAMAVVQRGGVAKYVDCFLPFALPLCVFNDWEAASGNPPPELLQTDNTDTVAWGLPNLSGLSVNPPTVKDQLLDICSGPTAATADCSEAGSCDAEGVEEMQMQNGVAANVFGYMADLINGDIASDNVGPWPTDYFAMPDRADNDWTDNDGKALPIPPSLVSTASGVWGNNIQGTVPIVDHPCTTDPDTGEVVASSAMNQAAPIVGWTYAYVYDAGFQGSDKSMIMQFDFENDYDVGYGQCEGELCEGNVTGTYPPTQVW